MNTVLIIILSLCTFFPFAFHPNLKVTAEERPLQSGCAPGVSWSQALEDQWVFFCLSKEALRRLCL